MKIIHFFKFHALLLIAFLMVGIALSFKNAETKSIATTYYYISSDMTEGAFKNVSNWKITNSNGNCGSVTPHRPCKVTVQSGSTLASVLGSKTNSQVINISSGYKDLP